MAAEISMALIARRLGLSAEQSAELRERRRPIVECERCSDLGTRFVFMSNGEHCCRGCARALGETLGYRPVGMRADDIVGLE